MDRKYSKRLLVIVTSILSIAFGGCAAANKNVRLDYQPVVHATGGSGDLYVAIRLPQDALAGRSDVEWVLGEVTDGDGNRSGRLLSDLEPKRSVADAFIQELNAAGFHVQLIPEIPENAAKGVVLTGIVLKLDESVGLMKAQAKGSLKVKAEIWKDGRKITVLNYEEATTNSALRTDSHVPDKALRDMVATITRRAVPEIIQVLNGK